MGTDELVRMAAKLTARAVYPMNSGVLSLPRPTAFGKDPMAPSLLLAVVFNDGCDDATGYRTMMPDLDHLWNQVLSNGPKERRNLLQALRR